MQWCLVVVNLCYDQGFGDGVGAGAGVRAGAVISKNPPAPKPWLGSFTSLTCSPSHPPIPPTCPLHIFLRTIKSLLRFFQQKHSSTNQSSNKVSTNSPLEVQLGTKGEQSDMRPTERHYFSIKIIQLFMFQAQYLLAFLLNNRLYMSWTGIAVSLFSSLGCVSASTRDPHHLILRSIFVANGIMICRHIFMRFRSHNNRAKAE